MAAAEVSRSVTSLGGLPTGGGAGGGAAPGPGGVKQNLPVIEHPMAKLDRDNLSVRGLGPPPPKPPTRQRTFVTIDRGEVKLGLDRANLPPLGAAAKDWTGRSLSQEVDTLQALVGGRYMPSRIVTPPEYSPRAGRWEAKTGFSIAELQFMIADRLDTGFHGVKHLFKGNDPNGQGVVSKEALLKIVYSVCGYVAPDQFTKLLKSLGLNGKTTISFEDFAQCFRSTQKSSKAWLNTAQRVAMALPKRPEVALGYRNGAVSAALCHSLLKDRARAGDFYVQDVLPEASFQPGGMVIPPQLHDMLTHLGYKLSDEEFNKLWQRYDSNGSGVLTTSALLRKLGLDENGKVRPYTSPRHAPILTARAEKPQRPRPQAQPQVRVAPPRRLPPLTPSSDGQPSEKDKENVENTARISPTEEPVKKKRFVKRAGATPQRLDKISHCLHLKFEEPYNNLLQGMQVFDFLKDGFVARIDFKKVLEEYGMPISVIDLEYFLSRCGIRTLKGQIVYRDFLMKFFNRSESGLVHRVVSNSPHLFGGGRLPPLDFSSSLTAEQMEIRLVDFLHTDFLSLMTAFRKCDKYNLGVVTKYEFRAAIERILGHTMSDRQYQELLTEVTLDEDGLLPYTAFMESFNKPPGSWNKRQVGVHSIAAIRQEGTPPEVMSLKAEADELMSQVRAEVAAEEVVAEKEMRRSKGMNTNELTNCLADFFRHKFHSFDKAFKNMDRRVTGRFNVHQFGDILKRCDMVLMPVEVDRLWETLPVSSDNMLSFSALMRYISTLNKGPPPIRDKLPMEDATDLIEKAKRVIKERKEQKQREAEHYSDQPVRVEIKKVQNKDTEQMLERLRPEVSQHWDKLKQLLRHMDPAGRTLVACGDMREVFAVLRFPLGEVDTDRLLHVFAGPEPNLFNYMEFLKYYTKSPRPVGENLSLSSKLEQKLVKEWKNLRRAFRKSDSGNNGYLGIDDFRSALTSVGITLSEEDLFRILSEFDTDVTGKISYEHFLNRILSMPI